jgi:hypothetical protein
MSTIAGSTASTTEAVGLSGVAEVDGGASVVGVAPDAGVGTTGLAGGAVVVGVASDVGAGADVAGIRRSATFGVLLDDASPKPTTAPATARAALMTIA